MLINYRRQLPRDRAVGTDVAYGVLRMVRKIMIVAAMLGSSTALAAHPLATDDVGTQGAGRVEVEASALAAREPSVDSRVQLGVGLSVHAGLAERFDLGASTTYFGSLDSGWDSRMGDPVLDLKWRLIDPEALPGLALRFDYVAPQAQNGQVGHGGGVVLITSLQREAWEGHFNVGALATGIGTTERALAATASLGAGWLPHPRLRLLAESVIAVDAVTRAVSANALAALQWQATEAMMLSVGVGPGALPTPKLGWLLAFGLTVAGG